MENNYSDLRKREEHAVIAVYCASGESLSLQSHLTELRAPEPQPDWAPSKEAMDSSGN